MSDMNNENLPKNPEQQSQAGETRVMPPVEASSRPARRRRSERYQEEPSAESTPAAPLAPAETEQPAGEDGLSAAQRLQTRIQIPQETVVRPSVPRPNVLNRVAEQSAAQDSGVAMRRPMGTPPGFAPRQPLASDAQDQTRAPLVTRSSTGTGPKLPPSVAGNTARRPSSSGAKGPAQEKPKGHRWLVALVILLLVIGLLVVGFLMLSQGDDGLLSGARNAVTNLLGGKMDEKESVVAATASGFTATIDRGTAPLDVMFNLTTSKSVTEVRLANEDGEPLNAMSFPVTENADSIIWTISMSVNDGYEGLVQAQIYDGASWLDTGMSQSLEIAMPSPSSTIDVAAFSETTEEPTEEPTEQPTDAPTDVPTDAPTDEPTEEPTEEPEEEPAQALVDELPVAVSDEPPVEPTEKPEAETEASDALEATPTLAVTDTPPAPLAVTDTPIPAALAATQAPLVADAPTDEPEDETTDAREGEDAEPVGDDQPEETEDAPTSAPTATPPLTGTAAESADPALIKDTVIYSGSSSVNSYTRERTLNMPVADQYITQPYGVLTYRGNAFRQNASVGTVGDISEMTLAWTAEAGSAKGASSTYYGIGWTGQPAIIKWSKEVRAATNIVADKKATTALKEVIVAGLDGKIYFLDLADGQPTRDAINLGYPMRGTPSLHPLGYPIMAVGQYGRKMASGTGDIGLRVYNLLTLKQVYWIDGLDGKANRPYYGVGAFDTSALIDPNSDTMVAIGTNGMLYTATLNTEYSVAEETVTINPSVVSMKSRTNKQADKYTAVQSSPAMYGTYVYYADMEGILRCVDTTTMTTVWAVDTDDAVEAAIALDMDDRGDLWLYTVNTLENRKKGDSTIRRYNALTGEASWAVPVNVVTSKNGATPGAMASPVIGQYELADLAYFTLSNVSSSAAEAIFGESDGLAAGVLLALDKTTGEIAWAHRLDAYSYSSPVAVYAEDGRGWIIQASSSGLITLLDGLTGAVVNTLEVKGTIDASPAVYNDTLVIGTTGKNTSFIYGIKLQ